VLSAGKMRRARSALASCARTAIGSMPMSPVR
jgi:hypothetical protein